MDEKERYDRGMAQRRKVLGNAWVDSANAGKTPFNAEFQDFITRYAWGEVWTRPHFDERTRRVLVIGTMIALDKWDEFRMHVRAALVEGGFSADDIKEIIMQQAIYCGVPAANHAFKEAADDHRGNRQGQVTADRGGYALRPPAACADRSSAPRRRRAAVAAEQTPQPPARAARLRHPRDLLLLRHPLEHAERRGKTRKPEDRTMRRDQDRRGFEQRRQRRNEGQKNGEQHAGVEKFVIDLECPSGSPIARGYGSRRSTATASFNVPRNSASSIRPIGTKPHEHPDIVDDPRKGRVVEAVDRRGQNSCRIGAEAEREIERNAGDDHGDDNGQSPHLPS